MTRQCGELDCGHNLTVKLLSVIVSYVISLCAVGYTQGDDVANNHIRQFPQPVWIESTQAKAQ